MRILTILREINNYFFLLKQIRDHKKTKEWGVHNLRTGWFSTFGTVINLPPEVFQGEAIYYQMYVIEQMKPINRYLESLNLQEIIYPTTHSLVNPARGEYAYLVKYRPLFREFTWWWIITRSMFVGGIAWIQFKFGTFTYLWDLIVRLVEKMS